MFDNVSSSTTEFKEEKLLAEAQKKIFAAQGTPVLMNDFAETAEYLLHLAEKYEDSQASIPSAFQRLTVNFLFFVINNAENLMDLYNPPEYDFSEQWETVSRLLQYIDDNILVTEETINSSLLFKAEKFLRSKGKITKIKEKARWVWRRRSKIGIKKVKEVYNRTFRPTRYARYFLLNLKYNRFLDVNTTSGGKELCDDVILGYGKLKLYKASSLITRVDRIVSEGGSFIIEGCTWIPAGIDADTFKHFATVNGSDYPVEEVNRYMGKYCFDKTVARQRGFRITVPFADIRELLCIVVGKMIGGRRVVSSALKYGRLCPIGTETRNGFWFSHNYILKARHNCLSISPCSESEWKKQEELCVAECLALRGAAPNTKFLKTGSAGPCKWALRKLNMHERVKNRVEAALVRLFHYTFLNRFKDKDTERFKTFLQEMSGWFTEEETGKIRSIFNKYLKQSKEGSLHQIWLLVDRPNRADDNAEALFRYLAEISPADADIYFLLRKDSPQYPDLAKLGDVEEPLSVIHRMLHSVADYVLSSQLSEHVMNPYNRVLPRVRDCRSKPKVIFLQHGVTHNHNGVILGRYGRDFYGFVTTAKKEYEYMLSPLFHYSPKEVWLTGFPRFDRLYHDEKKIITIMPTWRQWLTIHLYDKKLKTKAWSVNPDFTESRYFKFYHALINHPKLIETVKEYGYQILFLPHVNFFSCAKLFTHPDVVKVYSEEASYRKVFAESNLVVTDYTSAVFDFAYLHKPVIYCQFDKEEFYARHTVKKGYFDFERDGFGPVTYDLESCVEQIIKYIRNDCRMEAEYEARISRFFAFHDRNCCERIYRRIRGTLN